MKVEIKEGVMVNTDFISEINESPISIRVFCDYAHDWSVLVNDFFVSWQSNMKIIMSNGNVHDLKFESSPLSIHGNIIIGICDGVIKCAIITINGESNGGVYVNSDANEEIAVGNGIGEKYKLPKIEELRAKIAEFKAKLL